MTFGSILDEVAPNIGSGFSPQSEEARRLVRRAVLRLFEHSPILLERAVSLCAYGDYLTLPAEIRRIIRYRMGGKAEVPQRQLFEYLENGPGMSFEPSVTHSVLIDCGFSPVIYQPPEQLRLVVMSDRDEQNAVVIIRGETEDGLTVRTVAGDDGEAFLVKEKLVNIEGRFSFKKITSITKPMTAGYIRIYAKDDDTGALYYLARLNPDSRSGSFRSYRLPGHNFSGDTPALTSVYALALMQPPSLDSDDDPVPLNSILAIEAMARALDLYRKGKYKEYQFEEQTAIARSRESISNDFPSSKVLDIQGDGFMMGDVQTL